MKLYLPLTVFYLFLVQIATNVSVTEQTIAIITPNATTQSDHLIAFAKKASQGVEKIAQVNIFKVTP